MLFLYHELKRMRDYHEKPYELSFWREGKNEVDILVKGPRGPVMAFECKTSADTISDATRVAFRKRFPKVPLFVVSLKDAQTRKLDNGVVILTWCQALDTFLL